MTCPTCDKTFHPNDSPAMPFCCDRCRLIDLGRWFNEEIGLPHEGDPGDAPTEFRDEED